MTRAVSDISGAEGAGIRRRTSPLLWAAIAAGAYLAVIAAVMLLSVHTGRPVSLCLFKRLTHLPCPTCGSSRAVLALLHGRVVQAWLYNPLVVTAGWAGLVILAVRAVTGRWPKLTLSKTAKRYLWVALAVAAAANWAWVVAAGR